MELIRISDCKLKIMLTPSDMRHFELNVENFGEDTAQMHRAFRLLMEEIREKTGFEAQDNRISVQYFPSREGGCEMFISNLQSEDASGSKATGGGTGGSLCNAPAKRTLTIPTGNFRRDCAYRFECIEDLLPVCRRLLGCRYIGESTAYRDENNCYYLVLTIHTSSPFSVPDELNFILEYGRVENAAMLKLYIREHGSVICSGNAVACLSALA